MERTVTASRSLPDGWRWVRLGDVCRIVIGRTPSRRDSRFWGGDHMWATIADITASDGIVHATKEGITEAGATLCRGRLLPAGTLMFSFKLSIGKMAFAGRDLFTNEAIAGLFPLDAERADKHYLRSALALVDYGDLTGHAAMGRT